MKRILLFGYYGFGNFGDDLILETLAEELSQDFQVSAVSFSNRHSRATQRLSQSGGLTLVPIKTERRRILSKFNVLYQAAQLINAGRRHDAIVFGGGTQIFETRATGFLPLLEMAIFVTALRLFYGKLIGHLFVGINMPKTRAGAFLLRQILKMSDFVVLRDRRSFEVCEAYGSPKQRLVLAADAAYLRRKYPKKASQQDPVVRIGISLFPYFEVVAKEPNKDRDYLELCRQAICNICAQTSARARIVFLGCQSGTALNDLEYAKRIACEFKGYEIEYADYDLDTKAHIALLGEIDVLVGMRLHILIAAILSGVPRVFALPYQDKVLEEAHALGIKILSTGQDIETRECVLSEEIAARKTVNEAVLKRLKLLMTRSL